MSGFAIAPIDKMLSHQKSLTTLFSAIRDLIPAFEDSSSLASEMLDYVSTLCLHAAKRANFGKKNWEGMVIPYLCELPILAEDDSGEEVATKIAHSYLKQMQDLLDDDESDNSDDDVRDLCNIKFNLAFGGKILLHDTKLRLKRGHRYGLVGRNGCGKTTLMTAINNGKLEDWPTHLTTFYVDSGSNVDNDFENKHVMDFLGGNGKAKEARELMESLQFSETMMAGKIGDLSGGWQMKVRICAAVLKNADILLLDEPTNHLDKSTVEWLTKYLKSLTETTVVTVSHDTNFMENICSDIIHYEKRENWFHNKLVNYKGAMSAFVEKQPQAKHYFELATSELFFKFPQPGRLEGIKTSTQRFLELERVDFRYPGTDKNQLTSVNLTMTLSSRVAVVGANGAGKTTLIKMLVGDTQPSNLGACKFFRHHNLRIAYVAQHSFHHVEQHYEQSPCDYIAWRFKDAYDREKFLSEGYRISEEEQKIADDWNLEGIWSRHMKAGKLEYEIKKRHVKEKNNKFYGRDELLEMGLEMHVKQADERIAAVEAGLDLRPITTSEIQKHLNDFGLEKEFGTYGKVKGLSGGQKVKLVLAAAMWNCPHLIVLDEPTNYLDREALGAFSKALQEFGGAVLMISHNKEFYSSVCNQQWVVADGTVNTIGTEQERAMKAVSVKKTYEKEVTVDAAVENAGGNANVDGDKYKDASTNFWGKALSKKEERNFGKAKKKGDVEAMRKILAVPMGKLMPGYEELGDGKAAKK